MSLFRLWQYSIIWRTIVSTSAIAPFPVSPHIKVFDMHGISRYPHCDNLATCSLVTGWSHMKVFIAGQKKIGLLKFHALAVHSRRLSHSPCNYFRISLTTLRHWPCSALTDWIIVSNQETLWSILCHWHTCAIFAKLLASNGAITNTSAHFVRSICKTGSPLPFQAFHSSVSVSTGVSGESVTIFTKCLALSVSMTFIWWKVKF